MSSIEKAVERLKKTENSREEIAGLNTSSVGVDSHPPYISDNDEADCHIDLAKLEHLGFLTPETGRSHAAEEYRLLKRPLLMNAFGQGVVPVERGNLVMVTSALPGEGKTFTAMNLAMSMAVERDTTVLLIDGDVVRSSLTELLGLSGRKGLIDVLLDPNCHLSDVILTTDIPNIRVLPAGNRHEHSTELLASVQMRRLTRELSERYSDRIVLFDAPPILATSEASVLAPLLGQILMVVEAARTPQSAVKTALAKLDDDKVIGLVLNKSRQSFSNEYYGGYYYRPQE